MYGQNIAVLVGGFEKETTYRKSHGTYGNRTCNWNLFCRKMRIISENWATPCENVLSGICGQRSLRSACSSAGWPGSCQSTIRIIWYYGKYEWRAKAKVILCACAVWSESARLVHVWKHFFSLVAPKLESRVLLHFILLWKSSEKFDIRVNIFVI